MSLGPQPKPIRRTASDLRSSATARPGQLPHKTHMRLVCLEMERYRKLQECQNLLARAQRCKERCAAIDVEVRQLMAVLDRTRAVGGALVQAEAKPLRPIQEAPSATRAALGPVTHSY